MLYALITMSFLMPVTAITAFVIGYNINAQKKIFRIPKKKPEKTEDEIMLERIDNARI